MQTFAWNQITGHLLGIFFGGMVINDTPRTTTMPFTSHPVKPSSTSDALKIHPLDGDRETSVLPIVRLSWWTSHPHNDAVALSFSADQVTIMPRSEPINATSLAYQLVDGRSLSFNTSTFSTSLVPNSRRPSQAYNASPSEIEQEVHNVFIPPASTLAMVEIYSSTTPTRHRLTCLLTQMKSLSANVLTITVPRVPDTII